ncbi:MAG: DUF4230 domain-containing protein, partial [Chloroflexaceae bacterium]|nr:DUF4230 domain-containing protein [Chloroflexaceae bacterium]
MARNRDFDDEDEYERPSRENMMQRRLRKARGEDVDDDDDIGYNDYADDERDYAPRSLSRPVRRSYAPGYESGGGGGMGCSPGLLATLLGVVAVVLLGLFFVNRIAGSIGGFFSGGPNIATLIVTPTPEIRTGTAVIQRIQQLNRLETTSYTVERVIEVGQGSAIQLPLLGDLGSDRLLLIAHGNVIAGVDLAKLRPEDVTVSADGRSLSLRLPPVEIFRQSL